MVSLTDTRQSIIQIIVTFLKMPVWIETNNIIMKRGILMNEFDEYKEGMEEYEEENPVISLLDDNNKEVHFEILDSFDYNGKSYTVLLPYEEGDDEVVILEVNHREEDDEFLSIESEELLVELFEEFKKRNKDYYNFED